MTKLVTIAAALFLLATPVGAAQREHVGNDVDRLMRVAERLEHASRNLHLTAKNKLRRAGPRQGEALRALAYLEQRTTRFRQRVDKYAHRPDRLRREVRRLDKAFKDAEHQVNCLRRPDRLKGEFARVQRLVRRAQHRYDEVLVAQRERRERRYEVASRQQWGQQWELARRWGLWLR